MAEITKQYTYKLPDTYFGNTWEQQKTASAMYTGPKEGYVFVNAETGELVFDESFHPIFSTPSMTEEEYAAYLEDSLGTRCNPAERFVKIDAARSNEETAIAAAMTGIDTSEWPDKEYAFPEGHPNAGEVYHVDPDPLPITDALDIYKGIVYDFETETWSFENVPFQPPYCTEERHLAMLQNQKANAVELKESRNWDADAEAELDRFIAECDAAPTKFAGVHWLMIKFPKLDETILYPETAEPTAAEAAEAQEAAAE